MFNKITTFLRNNLESMAMGLAYINGTDFVPFN